MPLDVLGRTRATLARSKSSLYSLCVEESVACLGKLDGGG